MTQDIEEIKRLPIENTGSIYGIFKMEIRGGIPVMKDCFFNNHFEWLFCLINEIDALAWALVGADHMFVIKLDKKKDMAK